MSFGYHLSRPLTSTLSTALLIVAGVAGFGGAKAWLGEPLGNHAIVPAFDSNESVPLPDKVDAISMTMTLPQNGSAKNAHLNESNCDKIDVAVGSDGALRILGETMSWDQFRSLLDNQVDENLRTFVAITPDEDCTYRHIGRIISTCDRLGIPHQMVVQHASNAQYAPRISPAKRA